MLELISLPLYAILLGLSYVNLYQVGAAVHHTHTCMHTPLLMTHHFKSGYQVGGAAPLHACIPPRRCARAW